MQAIARRAGRIARLSVVVAAALLWMVLPAAAAKPGTCAATPTVSSGGQDAELARLRRQIAANEAFSAKYRCASGKTSLACREIFGRISQASHRLSSLSAASAARCDKMIAVRSSAQDGVSKNNRSAVSRDLHRGVSRETARIETMCVRLSDGYYFPSPNSGYGRERDMDKVAVQCRFICDDPQMEVYRMTGTDRNADEMVSLTTGRRYADLPSAGAYRISVPPRTCDMARYHRTALARTPPSEQGDLGVSNSKPVVPVPMLAMNMSLMRDVGLRGSRSVMPDRPRKMRVIGAAFLPVED